MLRLTATTALAVLIAGPAFAEAHEEKCFDKGTLTYVDCPKAPAPVPAPAPVIAPMIDESGFYLGLIGGASWFGDTDFDITGANVDNEYDIGWAAFAQAGYEWDDLIATGVDFRLDLEAGYLAADVDVHNAPGALAGSVGDTDAFTLMTNAYVDFNVTDRFDLFVGGGAGIAFVEFDGHGVTAPGIVMNDDDVAFAFHLDAGASYDLTDMIILEARYRYFNAPDVDLTSTAAGGGVQSSTTVDSHNALVGVRVKF